MKIKPKTYWSGAAFFAVLAAGFPALAEDASVGDTVIHLAYSIDTFYFLMSGALVMWMAAGFAMLEAGLVRGKNTVEILTKNVALYSIACIMYRSALITVSQMFLPVVEIPIIQVCRTSSFRSCL